MQLQDAKIFSGAMRAQRPELPSSARKLRPGDRYLCQVYFQHWSILHNPDSRPAHCYPTGIILRLLGFTARLQKARFLQMQRNLEGAGHKPERCIQSRAFSTKEPRLCLQLDLALPGGARFLYLALGHDSYHFRANLPKKRFQAAGHHGR